MFRYSIPFSELTGEEILYEVAKNMYGGNEISAADKLLGDFRRGFMGLCSLEVPPVIVSRSRRRDKSNESGGTDSDSAKLSVEELESSSEVNKKSDSIKGLDIGRGNYDGW